MREDVVNDVDALALQHRLVDPMDDLLCRARWSPRAMRFLSSGVSGRSAHAAAKCNTTSIIIGNYTTPEPRPQLSLKSKGQSISVTRSQSQTVPVIVRSHSGDASLRQTVILTAIKMRVTRKLRVYFGGTYETKYNFVH